MSDRLGSEDVVVSATFSYHGSAARIWKITDNNRLLTVPVALCLIAFAWMFVTCWYAFMYIFLGVLFIPYRLIRRSSRKRKMENKRHRELLEAIQSKAK